MLTPRKRRQVIAAGIALVALLGLALGLSQVAFKPGTPANLGNSTATVVGNTTIITSNYLEWIVKALYGLAILVLVIYTIYMLIDKERRKLVAKTLLRILPLLVIFYFISQNVHSCAAAPPQAPTQPLTVLQSTQGSSLPETVFNPNLSPTVILIASLLIALIAAILVMLIVIRIRQANQRINLPLSKLANQAQAALDALDAGGDLRNAVLRCYYEMNRILLEEKNIRRDTAMTPREFEAMLAAKGLPDEPIQQLTRLFEAVRYGAGEPGLAQENQARTSLSAIIAACRSMI